MSFVFAAMLGIFAVVYAVVRHGGSLFARIFYKCAASVSFILLAVSVNIGAPEGYYVLILCGLCASLAGDAVLVFSNRGGGFVLAGMLAFAAAQLFYIAAFWTIAPPSWVDAVLFAALITLAASLLHAKDIKVKRSTVGLSAYVVLLCAMAARAISMLWVRHPVLFSAFAAGGGALFVLSDLLLGIEQQTGSKAAGSMATLTYYAAQGLIAYTVMLAAT